MKTTNEIRIAGLRLVEDVARLTWNVKNGCISDKAELTAKRNRLDGFKKWAIENDQIMEVQHFFTDKGSDFSKKFIWAELASFFNN